MLGSNDVANQFPRVAEFYHGKSIFLTGATGFVGTVLMETLLRCCPGIKFLYILLRPKENMQPEMRKTEIFKKKIFQKLKKETPDLLEKVCVMSGDVTLPNLGMDEVEIHMLHEEASIVFHCAADTRFKTPLKLMLISNVLSLNNVIQLCRKMKNLEVLVYTSTAYSNSNHLNFPLKEEVYRLPFHARKFLDALENEDKEKLQELFAHCKPDWPNTYCFSKCLAENVITDTASDLPVAIIRPSVVFSTWKHPISGYVEENSGAIKSLLLAGKGVMKVLNGDPNSKMNLVPADIVANAHILAAWNIGTKRCVSPFVVNCTATENLDVKISDCFKSIVQLCNEFPLPQSFDLHSNMIIVPNRYLYCIISAYYHYLPAIVLDGMLRLCGKKSRLCSLYRYIDNAISCMKYFWFHSFEYERNNLEYLDKSIYPEDRKDLTLNFRDATCHGIALSLPEGSHFFDWKNDKRSQAERQRMKHKRHMQISFIQGIFLMTCCLLIYWVFSSIFH